MSSKKRILLGIDYGEARTGIAVGQEVTRTASPVTTLKTTHGAPDWEGMAAVVREWRPHLIIVGMPRTHDESPHRLTAKIMALCTALERRFGIPVQTVDESFTSVEASERLKFLRQSGRRRRVAKTDIDKMAAALLLERWMALQVTDSTAAGS